MPIPSGLIEQIKTGNVVLFCGAGISASAGGIPSSGQLVQELAQRAGLGDAGKMSLPQVAQDYQNNLGRQDLIAFIAERIEGAGQTPLRTHQLVAALSFKYIITTNWDTLQEEALRLAGKRFAKVVRDNDVAYVDENKVILIKLHGSVDQRDTIVVTGDDYYDVFARLPVTANLVRSYFATKTLLFLGFSLADEDFRRMFREVEQHLGKHMRRAYAVQLNPQQTTVDYWRQKNVEIINADVAEFLEELSRALEKDTTDKLEEVQKENQLAELYGRGEQQLADKKWSDAIACFKELEKVDPGYKDAQEKLEEAESRKRHADLLRRVLVLATSVIAIIVVIIVVWRLKLSATVPPLAPIPDCRIVALSLNTLTGTLTTPVQPDLTPVRIDLPGEAISQGTRHLAALVGAAELTVDGTPIATGLPADCKCQWHARIRPTQQPEAERQTITTTAGTCNFSLPLPPIVDSIELSLTVGTHQPAYQFFLVTP